MRGVSSLLPEGTFSWACQSSSNSVASKWPSLEKEREGEREREREGERERERERRERERERLS